MRLIEVKPFATHSMSWYAGEKCTSCGEDGNPYVSNLNTKCAGKAEPIEDNSV